MSGSDYTDYLIGLGLAPNTIRAYVRWVREAEEWLGDHGVTLEEASATDVASFADARIVYTAACRGQARAALKHYWEMHERLRAPLRAVRCPPHPELVCRARDDDEAARLVTVSVGWHPQGTAVLHGLYLALRRTEIAMVQRSRFTPDLSWYTVMGKGSKTATLPVHEVLVAHIEEIDWRTDWLFPGRFGGPVAAATIWAYVQEVAEVAGVADLKPHELRHTALATANDVTGDLRAVQTFARHSRASTTSGYTRTKAERLRQISQSLDYRKAS